MGLNELKQGENVPGERGPPMDSVPEWMDFDKFQRGRDFFLRHSAAAVLALHCSLAVGLSVENLLIPLVFTGNSHTPVKSFCRYFHTFLYVVLWHEDDVWQADSKAQRSLKKVRSWHSSIATRLNKSKENSSSESKLYFSQYDMAIVQSGFFAALVMYPKKFGIKCSKQELDDYIFFWRGIGYLLGILDEYNLCSGTYHEVCSLCKEIEREVLMPSLKNPLPNFELMVQAYIEGTNLPVQCRFMTKEALFAFVYDCMGQTVPILSVWNYFRYLFLKGIVFFIYWCPYFEILSNALIMRVYHSQLHQLHL